jgi:LysM repeat protein
VEQPEPEAAFSTLQRGDMLSKIAGKHYGNASKYPLIFKANQPILKEPDKIYPGQKLCIPPGAPSLRRLGSHRIRWGIVPDRGRIPLISFPDFISPHEIGTIRRQLRRISV